MYNADPSRGDYTFVDGHSGGVPINVESQRPGEQLYEDVNPDGTFNDEDRTIIGQAQADVMFGINNMFNIGNLDISFFIDSQIGKDLAVLQNGGLLAFDGRQALDVTVNRWTPENPSNIWPRLDSSNRSAEPWSDRYIEDASFIRLQNATIGYNFDSELARKFNISALRLYVSGTNLFTWTDYTAFSPDVSVRGSSTTNLGHDNAGYPQGRTIRMGINIKF